MHVRLIAILDRFRGRSTALSAVFAMTIRASGALLTVAIFTLAARAMSSNEFGELAVWFNAMSFLAVAATFGQETLIARSWGEYMGQSAPDLARGAYRFGWCVTLASAALFSLALVVGTPLLGLRIEPAALYAGVVFLFMQTLLHYSSHSCRVITNFVVSETNRELTWRLLLLAVVLWASLRGGLTTTVFFIAAAVGIALAIAIQSYRVWRHFASLPPVAARASAWALWFVRARDMWLSAIIEATSQYADVMLIGYFASAAVAGEYFVAARIANIFLMIMSGLNSYSAAHGAVLYFSGQTERLQEIMRTLVIAATLFAVPLMGVIFAFGPDILTIFGQRFTIAYPVLLTLATAAFIMCLCGSAAPILLTTGHERLYSRVIAGAALLRTALTALFASSFGALGAASAWAFVNVPLAIGLSYVCLRLTGVDCSIWSVLRKRGVAIAVDPRGIDAN